MGCFKSRYLLAMPGYSKYSLPFMFSDWSVVCISHHLHACYMYHPSHSPPDVPQNLLLLLLILPYYYYNYSNYCCYYHHHHDLWYDSLLWATAFLRSQSCWLFHLLVFWHDFYRVGLSTACPTPNLEGQASIFVTPLRQGDPAIPPGAGYPF
jgi:hypothetical protein